MAKKIEGTFHICTRDQAGRYCIKGEGRVDEHNKVDVEIIVHDHEATKPYTGRKFTLIIE